MFSIILSSISSSATSSDGISTSTTPCFLQYNIIIVMVLIIFLSLKEVLLVSKHWNTDLNNSFNIVILPLLLCFTAIIVFKIRGIV